MPYKVFTNVYESLVAPVIDYGAEIRALRAFSYINEVHNKACRVHLGIGWYAPNAGVQGKMGWELLFDRQWLSISKFHFRLPQMSEDRLARKIF